VPCDATEDGSAVSEGELVRWRRESGAREKRGRRGGAKTHETDVGGERGRVEDWDGEEGLSVVSVSEEEEGSADACQLSSFRRKKKGKERKRTTVAIAPALTPRRQTAAVRAALSVVESRAAVEADCEWEDR
jgi:hypothetical protein